ncbi:MAG TPA: NADH-quinone oxidoreductase subunit A [Acidimicrobiales bacterium]|nr:NADH-quinone oxidoreductase subunit A [Acidimicrobiales bacterium]
MAAAGAALTVVVAALVVLLATRALGPALAGHELTAPERLPFAGGAAPEVHAWSRYHVRYYAMALLFLAFDMEMVFMYPWAVVFVEEGMTALVEMLMFIAILVLGILYAWREGALSWA